MVHFHKTKYKSESRAMCEMGSNDEWWKNQGPYSWKILVLRVAPSNKILRKFLEMWTFPLKIKEKIPVKIKVIQKAS